MNDNHPALRDLSAEEIALVAGGAGITVTGYRDADYDSSFYGPGDEFGDGTSGGVGEETSPEEPDCHLVNPISGLNPPDGAKYYLPENVTEQYLMDALNHLSSFARNHTAAELILEFKAMYQDRNHPHYIDFKDWGTNSGPPGSAGATMTYYSGILGRDIETSAFEPFGNWFYGFAGTWAGISQAVLYAGAAWMQEGDTGWFPSDAPEDQAHVDSGIAAAQAYKLNPQLIFQIHAGDCSSGTTMISFGNSAELGPAAESTAEAWSNYEDSHDSNVQPF